MRDRLDAVTRRLATPLLGLAVGVLTLILQGRLDGPWAALANSASPWLLVALLAGCLQRNVGAAAVVGGLTCLGEVAGYYAAAGARGFGVSDAAVVFWVLCSVVGGPIFGACGRLARENGARVVGALAAAAPGATFVGEGIGSYWLRLGYRDDAALFVGIGVVVGAIGLALTRWRATTFAMICLESLVGVLVYEFVFRKLA